MINKLLIFLFIVFSILTLTQALYAATGTGSVDSLALTVYYTSSGPSGATVMNLGTPY